MFQSSVTEFSLIPPILLFKGMASVAVANVNAVKDGRATPVSVRSLTRCAVPKVAMCAVAEANASVISASVTTDTRHPTVKNVTAAKMHV